MAFTPDSLCKSCVGRWNRIARSPPDFQDFPSMCESSNCLNWRPKLESENRKTIWCNFQKRPAMSSPIVLESLVEISCATRPSQAGLYWPVSNVYNTGLKCSFATHWKTLSQCGLAPVQFHVLRCDRPFCSDSFVGAWSLLLAPSSSMESLPLAEPEWPRNALDLRTKCFTFSQCVTNSFVQTSVALQETIRLHRSVAFNWPSTEDCDITTRSLRTNSLPLTPEVHKAMSLWHWV